MSKVVAIIQQRMGSTRLPGKALLPLAGKSMTQNIIERVKRATLVDQVVLAVPRKDAPHFSANMGVAIVSPLYRYKENDLLSRYVIAAKYTGADYIVRICGDNPCVEPEFIDYLVEEGLYRKLDRKLLLNSENFWPVHDGFGGEFYSRNMLEWMNDTIKAPSYREHMSNFWYDVQRWKYTGSGYPPGFRLDVNTPADYEKLKKVYDHFGNNEFHVDEAVKFVQENLEERPIPAGERSGTERL